MNCDSLASRLLSTIPIGHSHTLPYVLDVSFLFPLTLERIFSQVYFCLASAWPSCKHVPGGPSLKVDSAYITLTDNFLSELSLWVSKWPFPAATASAFPLPKSSFLVTLLKLLPPLRKATTSRANDWFLLYILGLLEVCAPTEHIQALETSPDFPSHFLSQFSDCPTQWVCSSRVQGSSLQWPHVTTQWSSLWQQHCCGLYCSATTSNRQWPSPALATLFLLPSVFLWGGVVCSNTSPQGRLSNVWSHLSLWFMEPWGLPSVSFCHHCHQSRTSRVMPQWSQADFSLFKLSQVCST